MSAIDHFRRNWLWEIVQVDIHPFMALSILMLINDAQSPGILCCEKVDLFIRI
jgi:hypothetical protein